MINDYYGCPIYTERDLVDIYMKNPKQKLNNTFTDKKIEIDPTLEIENAPHLIEHTLAQMSVADFDEEMRSKWHMPQKYRELDIAKWLLDQCKHEEEFQRVGKELLLYQKRGQFLLLQYMKYLVDLMRENNIVFCFMCSDHSHPVFIAKPYPYRGINTMQIFHHPLQH